MADFSEILLVIGDFGLFQKLLLVALCFPAMMMPFQNYSLIFTHAGFTRHCNTDWILKVSPNLTREEQLNLTVPRKPDGSLQSCEMFMPVDWDIEDIRQHGLNQTTSCLHGWQFDTSVFKTTVVSDFELVCDRASFLGIAQTIGLSGILFGSLIFGPLAKSLGRKRATQISLIIMAVFTLTTGFAPTFYGYLMIQFIVGFSYGGYRVNSLILATEWIGVTKRSLPSCISQVVNSLAQCIVAGVGYAIRDWRTVQLILTSPLLLVLFYVWLIPESARWLHDCGETEEAEKLIRKAAAVNKRPVPDNILGKINIERRGNRGEIKDLIASPHLRKSLLVISFAWFSLNLSYSCLTLNVGNFGLDIFLTQLIFGLTEIPGHILCIWLVEIMGRKHSFTVTILIGATLCLLIVAVPLDKPHIITALATSGRVCTTWAVTICTVYVQELFPTSLRQAATGLASIAPRVGGLLSPMLNLLGMYYSNIPILVFGGLTLVSGILSCLLPETRGKDLPDHSEEMDRRRDTNDTQINETCDDVKSTKL
nr:solute carrier family 22 member 13-like [Paramormyrops kingsleyae]